MKKILIGTVAGAALAIVALFGGTAIAGTGVGAVFNLGQTNTVNGQSVLTGSTPNGAALKIDNTGTAAGATGLNVRVPSGHPPFITNGTGKVVNLQADTVDGQHAGDLQNPAYTYTVDTGGGTGETQFTLPQVPAGEYLLTYTASFYPQGTPAAPVTFSCYSINAPYTEVTSQATTTGTYDSGYYYGVTGVTAETVPASGVPRLSCGAKNSAGSSVPWQWGSRKLQVTLVKLNGRTSGTLTSGARAQGGTKGPQPSTP